MDCNNVLGDFPKSQTLLSVDEGLPCTQSAGTDKKWTELVFVCKYSFVIDFAFVLHYGTKYYYNISHLIELRHVLVSQTIVHTSWPVAQWAYHKTEDLRRTCWCWFESREFCQKKKKKKKTHTNLNFYKMNIWHNRLEPVVVP